MIVNLKKIQSFSSCLSFFTDFIEDWSVLKECFPKETKRIDKEDLKDFEKTGKTKFSFYQKCEKLAEKLWDDGWSDEKQIKHTLKQEEETYILFYNEKSDCFDLYEVLDELNDCNHCGKGDCPNCRID